jgi:hypothetical protein
MEILTCSYVRCGGQIIKEHDLVRLSREESYHRGCYTGLRLKVARQVTAEIQPGALRVRMFHMLKGHEIN